jgi:hypothetical protein
MQPAMEPQITQSDDRHLTLITEKSKIFLNDDIVFTYSTTCDSLQTDFYAVDNDTMDGHFVMLMKSPSAESDSDVFPKNVVFVIDRSSDIFGATLSEAKTAIGECINRLNADDNFSIITFDYSYGQWSLSLVKATSSAKDSAIQFLSGISFSYGSDLSSALQVAFTMFPSDTTHNIIILFSDGKAVVDPNQIRSINTKKVAIIPIASPSTAGRQRLEMLAYLNYGIPEFLHTNEPLTGRIVHIFDEFNFPFLKDVHYEISPNVYDLFPGIAPSLYKGALLYFTGRYKNPGTNVFSIAGFCPEGAKYYDIPLTFTTQTTLNTFAEKFWAKENIDDIERLIAVYGENDSLKNADIALSLRYKIRCKYTAYIADKTEPVSAVREPKVRFTLAAAERTGRGTMIRWNFTGIAAILNFTIHRKNNGCDTYEFIAAVDCNNNSYFDSTNGESETLYRIDAIMKDGAIISSQIFCVGNSFAAEFRLYPNFPNPFNPTTTIHYQLPMDGVVHLTVFNVIGQEVETLANGQKPAGYYTATFNASELQSGVYFTRITSISKDGKRFTQTIKMVLLK